MGAVLDSVEVEDEAGKRSKNGNGNGSTYLKFKKMFENSEDGGKRAAIFSHMYPDPDAIGSQLGLKWLLEKPPFNINCDLFFAGKIAHPQNMTMVNLLEVDLKPVEQYNKDNYNYNLVVDSIPCNAGINGNDISFDCVIDHHRLPLDANFKGIYVNTKAGSCCAQIYDLMKNFDLNFDDASDVDSKVATALMVGITTDTENLMSDDATEYEFQAWSELFLFRDPIALKQIVRYQKPKFWTDLKTEYMKSATINERIGMIGLGIIPAKHRDVVADMADEMSSWEEIKTAIAFALIDGRTVEACVRSDDNSISVNELCKALGTHKHGVGGGKIGKGAYRYELGGGSIDLDDDSEDQLEAWKLLEKREKKRIMRLIKK